MALARSPLEERPMLATAASRIAVVIADDRPLVRTCLRRIVQSEPGLDVVREATDATSILAALEDGHCDVLLLDLDMRAPGVADLVARVRAWWPRLPILAVSIHAEPQFARAALRAGADAFVAKDSDPEVLVAALRRLARASAPVPTR
jgi:DNA-binding NarL/FixJ family response regulator